MLIGEIALGTFVTIELEREKSIYNLTSKLFDHSETEILIAPPQMDDISFRLLEGDKIVVYAHSDAHLYRWECEEWSYVAEGIVSTVRLKCSKDGEKYNRRNAFRIPIDLSLQATKEGDKKAFKISIRDISFLGVGFSTYEDLEKDEIIHFNIVDGSWNLPITVTVVRR